MQISGAALMKISDLSKRTGIPKETIHYYIREGLLPKPKKLGKNSAFYSNDYIDRVRFIKELQDNYFLPLSRIRDIFRSNKKEKLNSLIMRIKSEFLRPLDRLLSNGITGSEAFLTETGLTSTRLKQLKEAGIITHTSTVDGKEHYSHEVVAIGKLVHEIDVLRENMFPDEAVDLIQEYGALFQEMAQGVRKLLSNNQPRDGRASPRLESRLQMSDMTASFFYYMLLDMFSRQETETAAPSKPADESDHIVS